MSPGICIVGAGPAGLSAFHYLTRAGHRDVTLYEAAPRVGGKCLTVERDGNTHDLGAVLATPGYRRVLELVRAYGAETIAAPRHLLYDSTTGHRAWLGPRRIDLAALGSYQAGARALAIAIRHRRLAAAGFDDLDAELEQPIATYVAGHGLSELEAVVLPLFTGYGYGYAEDVSIAYLMKMASLGAPRSQAALADWVRLKAHAPARRWLGDCYSGLMFPGGYQSLFERIAARADVRLATPVTRVERAADQAVVEVDGRRRAFDRVILAVDPLVIGQILDLDGDERALLTAIRHIDYRSLLCRVDGAPTRTAVFYTDHMSPASRGRLLLLSQPHPPADRCVAYAIAGDGVDDATLERNIAADMATLGARLLEVLDHRRWAYFPHVGPDRMRTFHDGMRRMQGRGRVYFTGEFLNFATVEHACQSSFDLVERHFAAARGHTARRARRRSQPEA